MKNIGIFFGSDTGNTEKASNIIAKKISSSYNTKIYDIAKTTKADIEMYNSLLFGIPTWYYGEAQCDWDNFFPILKSIKFNNKNVGIFGFGDQEDYAEYFCDAMGILHNILKNNDANIIGYWPIDNYFFEDSKALTKDKKCFVGLALDDDRQPELTDVRINNWIKQLIKEINL
uniref:Flavodoxin n=1 Tax=Candidatus Aschnera chinzeii TaxID=1485666 RepID=A0AAT9G4Y8_9ENTR|nr:MAG: flavodoxin FldA [Candidatus Aschnera chinzeii]